MWQVQILVHGDYWHTFMRCTSRADANRIASYCRADGYSTRIV